MPKPPIPATAEPVQRPTERATWPCRYCQRRDSVIVTLRQSGTVVCFCAECEQGWTTDERGHARD